MPRATHNALAMRRHRGIISAAMSDVVNAKTLSLCCLTLAAGLSECAMMAILPETAAGLGVSLSQAGQYISAYALGVCVGAPLLALCLTQWPPKRILLLLALIVFAGNSCTGLSPNHATMVALRFVSGLPHGAVFGMATIVAERIAVPGKVSGTVAVAIQGICVSNVFCVPLCALLAQGVGWSSAFLFIGSWGLLSLLLIARFIPRLPSGRARHGAGMFLFLRRPMPWLLLALTLLTNNGYFCFYSYVKPYLTEAVGLPSAAVAPVLLLGGVGMCVGTWLSGRCADRYSPERTGLGMLVLIFLCLVAAFALPQCGGLAIGAVALMSLGVFGVALCWQVLILRYARGSELLGAASIQMAFNGGNALGAYLGGLPLDMGLGVEFTALPGILSLLPVFPLLVLMRRATAGRRAKR